MKYFITGALTVSAVLAFTLLLLSAIDKQEKFNEQITANRECRKELNPEECE